jgi:hypothetical protein
MFVMNAIVASTRGFLIASLYTIGLAAACSAHAAQPHFVGPRGTIPQTRTQAAPQSSFDQLQASSNVDLTCHTVHIKHYGHPGKGLNRIERINATCGRSRLSVR